MKFGQELALKRFPAWRHYYVNYSRLKKIAKEMLRDENGISNDNFITELHENLIYVTRFYDRREKELVGRVRSVSSNDNCKQLKDEIERLEEFANINTVALRKIAKKYDKMLGQRRAHEINRTAGPLGAKGRRNSSDTQMSPVLTKPNTLQRDLMAELSNHQFAQASTRLEELVGYLAQRRDPNERAASLRTPLLLHSASGKLATKNRPSLFESPSAKQIFKKYWVKQERITTPRLEQRNVSLPAAKPGRKWCRIKKLPLHTLAVFLSSSLACWLAWYYKLSNELTSQSYMTIVVTVLVLFKLVRGKSADGTLMLATLTLQLLGILNMDEAWSGFSNDVVLSVAILGVVAAGVESTGVVKVLFLKVLGRPSHFTTALLRLLIPANILNVGVSNTATMAILLPIIDKWAESINMPKLMFLMPLSYSLLISGTVAIFGTSSNLVAQGLITRDELPKFSTFEIAPVSMISTAAAVLVMLIMVPRLFPIPSCESSDIEQCGNRIPQKKKGEPKRFHIAIQIVANSLDGMAPGNAPFIRYLDGGMEDIVNAEHLGDEIESENLKELSKFDILNLYTTKASVINLARDPTVGILDRSSGELRNSFQNENTTDARELVEVVLDGLCPMLKQTLVNSVWKRYHAHVIGIRPLAVTVKLAKDPTATIRVLRKYVEDEGSTETAQRLQVGDNLILDAPSGFYDEYHRSHDFVMMTKMQKRKEEEADSGVVAPHRSRYHQIISGLILITMVAVVASGFEPLLPACMSATFLLVWTNCISAEKAIAAIKVRTVLTIVGAFGLGKAIGKTHVAHVCAQGLIHIMVPFGEPGILASVFIVTVCLGIVFHATAVVILLYPVCIACASQMQLPIHRILCVLMIGAGCLMLSPVSYQTNIMAYTAGNYDFNDFPKLGVPIVVAIGFVAIPASMYLIHDPVL